MTPLKVAVIADLLEEKWPSMDLVADMLVDHLRTEHAGTIEPVLIRPPLRSRAVRMPGVRELHSAFTVDRFTNRLWDYPAVTRGIARSFDIFHIVDHSYAHLVHTLPAARTLVTCHDLDTFRSILEPGGDVRSALFRVMTRRIFAGLCKAGHVACDTEATRDALVARGGVDQARTSVVLNGPHPSCTPNAEPAADVEAARLLGPAGRMTELLHVGSTIARKRIDVLLRVIKAVRRQRPDVRLIRVGGPFTAEQRALVRDLGLDEFIVVLPFLDRATLAAVYRRSALVLLPSEREGFGLPVLEALACGTPLVASDIDALREVGGHAAQYCPPEDLDAWTTAVVGALGERRDDRVRWAARRAAGIERAASFSWARYTRDVVALYGRLAGSAPGAAMTAPLQVVHVGKFYPPVRGGMERVLESLCEGSMDGVESRVIVCNTTRRTVREEVCGVGVTRVGTIGAAGSVPIAPSFPVELRRARGDLMVIHEPNPWALLSFAFARPALPVTVWFHSEVVRPQLQYALFYHPLAHPVYERARRIIVSSPLLAEHAAALAPYRDRVRVIPFGIDAVRWDATPAISARAGAIRAGTGSRPLILFAGRMVPYKGVGVLLRAMVGLDASAVLVGDGPVRAEWTALARELQLTDRVRFAGDVTHEELVALYHACDVFVLPSVTRAEAFGYVQLEAMACGKPVVSTRLPSGVPWVNRHGETGLTVPPGDVDALRRALAELGSDASLRARFGSTGRRRVESEFTMAIMRSAAAAVYREAVES